MNITGTAIIVLVFMLLILLVLMAMLSTRSQRMHRDRKEREQQYQQILSQARERELMECEIKAEGGNIPMMLYLAKKSERSDTHKAHYWYNKAAQLESVPGMQGIIRLSERLDTAQVLKDQANFWRLAIRSLDGELSAKLEMGQALIQGRGIARNRFKGISLIETAANGGHVEAMLYMGELLLAGDNGEQDEIDALNWFKQAANAGNTDAMIKVGLCYFNGCGTEKNHPEAYYWLELAAERGELKAMFHAGKAWQEESKIGNFVSYVWLFAASNLGYEDARKLRDEVANNIGVDLLVELQSVAKILERKIAAGNVEKHTLIKLLNKVWVRDIYFPKEKELDTIES